MYLCPQHLPLPPGPAPSYLPRARVTQACWDTWSPLRLLSLHGVGAAVHRAWGIISFQKRVFRPNAGIKGHLSIPRCPAPAFPNNIPLCPPARLPRPPPLSTLPPFTASVVSLFVCCAECKLFVVFFFSLPLVRPPSKPSLGALRLGRRGGLGAEAESMPGARGHPVASSLSRAEEGTGRDLVGAEL